MKNIQLVFAAFTLLCLLCSCDKEEERIGKGQATYVASMIADYPSIGDDNILRIPFNEFPTLAEIEAQSAEIQNVEKVDLFEAIISEVRGPQGLSEEVLDNLFESVSLVLIDNIGEENENKVILAENSFTTKEFTNLFEYDIMVSNIVDAPYTDNSQLYMELVVKDISPGELVLSFSTKVEHAYKYIQ